MMFLGGRDGFLTQLQETGEAFCTITATDDLVVAVGTIQAHAAPMGDVRVFVRNEGSLAVRFR